jgi:hypothetical protein
MCCLILVCLLRAFGEGCIWQFLEEQSFGELCAGTRLETEGLIDRQIVICMSKLRNS